MHKRRYAQRKHIIQSFDNLLYQLHVLAFFNSNVVGDPFPLSTLLIRVMSQSQCSKPRELDPAWSLRVFLGILVFLNVIIIWNHATATVSDKAVILDFIGSAYVPTKLRLICFDIFILCLQMLLTVVSYETSLAKDDESVSEASVSHSDPHKSYPYVIDLRFSTVIARLRTPHVASAASLDGLPLPNTSPWPLPAVGLRVLLGVPLRRTGRNTGDASEAVDSNARIPGALNDG
ncbi:hypothetical protein C8F01DRAFT_1011918 [Mycena amicta]|nr:hypothetical protein C8F01DRAFT_1011918 [Mycena amicta]